MSVSSSLCIVCIRECQTSSCVRTGQTTSFPSCTTRHRGSQRWHISGPWRREWTTVKTTQFMWWIAVSATSLSSRPSHRPLSSCLSSLYLVHTVVPRYCQPFMSLSLVLRLWSQLITRCHSPRHPSATDFLPPRPSTSASYLSTPRNSRRTLIACRPITSSE